MEFVGRHIELGLLRSQFDEALGGHPRLALIEGPPGIGKTALVDRFLGEYGDVQVLRASGEEAEALLECGVVDQLLSSQGGSFAMPRQAPLEDHLKVGAQVLDLLGHLQERGPVILVIDDLHLADQTSLKALLFALRRLQADRVLALLVMRGEETHRLPEGLSRLIHSGVAARQQLRGLESADLRELAALMGVGAFSAGAAERLHQHTEGNPLYARALLAELPAEIWRRPELTVPAPHSFSLLVLSRRAQRSHETRQLLDAASVLGMHSSLDLAARLADIPDPLAAVDEASAAGLLQIEQVGKREIAFPHPLVAAAIYHGLSISERARLHARAATLVDDQASSLRHRVAATATADPQLAADLADFARREAGQGAWASAAAHLVKACRLSPGRSERERLLLEAVNWMLFSGSLSQPAELREEISSFAGGALRDCILGQLALLEGRPGEAERLLANAWKQCDPAIDAELAATIALRDEPPSCRGGS